MATTELILFIVCLMMRVVSLQTDTHSDNITTARFVFTLVT